MHATQIRLFYRFAKLAALPTLMALSLAACKKAPAPAASVVDDTPKAIDLSHLTDEQLVHANQQAGLGLGLQIPGGPRKAGEPITLHVVIEDIAAKVPVASGLCGGLFLNYEDTTSHDSGGGEISSNHSCFTGDPYPDSVPLEKGKLKVLDIDLQNATHLTVPPGSYLVSLDWKAYPVGPPTIAEREPYTHMHSNAVPLTVR
jgi:hypothetical protein